MGAQKVDMTKDFYEELRKVEWKDFSTETCEHIAETLWKMRKDHPKGAKKEDVAQVVHLAARVAHHTDFESFKNFMENGDVPPFRLSKQEMTCLKGGGFWNVAKWVGIGVAAGAAVYFGGKAVGAWGNGGITAESLSRDKDKWDANVKKYNDGVAAYNEKLKPREPFSYTPPAQKTPKVTKA